jgi:hypothetical protein
MTQQTQAKAWKPTARQQAVQKIAALHDYSLSGDGLCAEAGLDDGNLDRWFKQKAFGDWWKQMAERHFARKLPRIWGTMYKRAIGESKKGNHKDALAILQRFDPGFVPRTQQDVHLTPELADDKHLVAIDELLKCLESDKPPALPTGERRQLESAPMEIDAEAQRVGP